MANYETSTEFHNNANRLKALELLAKLKEREKKHKSTVEVLRGNTPFKITIINHFITGEKKKKHTNLDTVKKIVYKTYNIDLNQLETKEIYQLYQKWLLNNSKTDRFKKRAYLYKVIDFWIFDNKKKLL